MTSTPASFNPDVTQRTAAANIAALAPRIAVLIPCYNEAEAIETVVKDFAAALPTATIYVYDNNSKDDTKARAARAGAIVRTETFQGKGNVVRRMFADIEAEAYVLVDGDGTYDAASAAVMVDTLLANSLDMVNGSRVPVSSAAFRPGHVFGNKLLTGTVAAIFGNRLKDMLSGYRVFSRRFVKSFPALATGFETETELTVHALELRLPLAEIQTPYRDRPPGSKSKLNTFRDGFRILRTIVYLVKEERPMQFFSLLALALFVASLALGWPVVVTFLQTGLVPRLPTAVLAVGIMILAAVSFIAGLILDTVTLSRREMKRLHYLGLQGPTFRERRRAP
ncbi:MAG TPA: glycosyltransferase [Steroidobacter sp.]|uniref:glycosyltransferase n=1 Tax=Steroidobacter sp. TaxID=1978227 RepID=UPI002EDA6CC6